MTNTNTKIIEDQLEKIIMEGFSIPEPWDKENKEAWERIKKTFMPKIMNVVALVQKETQEQTEKRYSRLIKAIDEAAAEWHDIHTSREGCPFCERGALGKQLQKLVPSIQENVKDKSEEVLATSEVTQGKEKA